MHAITFAVKEINDDPKLLPNITLGFQVFDTCNTLRRAAQGTLIMLSGAQEIIPNYNFLSKAPLAGIVGDSGSTRSIFMGQILGLYRYPQISYFSTNPVLSQRDLFPSFFRTIPSDEFQMRGLAQLVSHFGWSWVGLLASDNDYGQSGLHIVKEEIIKVGVCVAFAENILTGLPNRNAPYLAKIIKNSTAKAVVVISSDPDFVIVVEEMLLPYIKNVNFKTKGGRQVFFDANGDIPAVYDIVNWRVGAKGTLKQVKIGSYDSSSPDGKTFKVDGAAITWTNGENQVPLSNCSPSCPLGFRKVTVPEKPLCCHECARCPQGQISNQTDALECHPCSWDTWPNLQQDRCLPRPTEFLSYGDPLSYSLAATAIFSSLVPLVILGVFINYKETPIVRANNYPVSCLLLFSLFLCFLCSLGFIGYPQPEKCLLRQVAFGMVFALCISCVLAKTITVVIAFNATKPGSRLRKWTGVKVPYFLILCCALIQLCICVIWLIFFQPFHELDTDTKPGIIIVNCNEGSSTAFWCMLGYLGLLATISFIVAFLARRLPDSFNEAKLITFSMLAFLSVWVSFIPAYLSARGMYTVAMEVFAILSSSWALVGCIFVPKCFIILFSPHINSREHFTIKPINKI
ncbi:vomeronasal type-2 receptor 26 [Xenopus tropicalis]|uniref:Vomeronasal type-2 receptor 26 n=1 Tax=Xenopus tropicalis TaxID=8364 RepID=A0A8J0T2X7_XENTR|nr:vomeronasal type-2 receptor 26 [Xenopus tropicalis]|eukprot:XP_017948199.1 PREDICTED: vomeronasal type-2 receptor 26-like [Xenopus tropicalis]